MGAFRRRWRSVVRPWEIGTADTGEPAFRNSWEQSTPRLTRLAFRLRESGVVDMAGIVPAALIDGFTLPPATEPV